MSRKTRPRGIIPITEQALADALHLPPEVHVKHVEYEISRDMFYVHVYGDGVEGMDGYTPVQEGMHSPMLQHAYFQD